MSCETVELLTLPVFKLEILKRQTLLASVDDIIARLRVEIDQHPCARFIGVFDHYAHTRALPDGEVAPEIRDAKNLVFCFGMSLPEPAALATRPRSLGIAELDDRFVVVFLEPPMPVANGVIERWVRALADPPTMAEPAPASRMGLDAAVPPAA